MCHDIGICSTYRNLQASEEGKTPCDEASNQKAKSNGALCISLSVTVTGLSPKCIYRSICLPAVFFFRTYVQELCWFILTSASLYGSDDQNQCGSLRPNLKSQMEMSYKTSVSSPAAFYAAGLLWEGAECGSL